MSSMDVLKRFDHAQLWRFFVDGRFQKKYDGWIGYEEGEKGSVQALLNGFSFMLENFDISRGLRATYLRELHKISMLGVETNNLKSSPGDIRFLNSGMPFFAKTTTYEHLVEVFELRRGDGTAVFNNKRFNKPVEELDLEEVWAYLQSEGKINYRNWYPNVDLSMQRALLGEGTLHQFYTAKHAVQMLIVDRMEEIVGNYNRDIQLAKSRTEKLRVITLVSRELELLHPFPDGNSRTFSCITMLHLLLYNGFTPALLENPNLDNEVSHAQWVTEVERGMERMEILLEDPHARVFNYAIGDMSAGSRKQFLAMASDVIKRIENHREIYLTPQRLSDYSQGEWLGPGVNHNLRFTGVGTYGTYSTGNVYFLLSVEEWLKAGKNPHEELERVLRRGIRALVVDDASFASGVDIPVLLVKDCFLAFKQCAIRVRQGADPLTLLVTGTEGKTGAKVQLHHLLKDQVKTHAILNSANTEVPVLRSLVNLEADDRVEINEVSVGSDEAYRVERANMVNPDFCLITNIGPNHMDMHKTLGNLMDAKSSVVEGLREGGQCIVNSEIEHLSLFLQTIERRRPGTPLIFFGKAQSNDAVLLSQSFDDSRLGWNVEARIQEDRLNYFVPLVQHHAPLASVGALLAVRVMGYDVEEAARNYASLKPYQTMGQIHRLQKKSGKVLFYDQSRRGGIHGMRSAFQDIASMEVPGRVIALVGGVSVKKDSDWTREVHSELAELINSSAIDRLYTTGRYMNYVVEGLGNPEILVSHNDDIDVLARDLYSDIRGGDLLFIIGSAYLYLGRVADKLVKMKDRSLFDYRIERFGLSDEQCSLYRDLIALMSLERGDEDFENLNSSLTPDSELAAFRNKYPESDVARAEILKNFFHSMDECIERRPGWTQVNEEVSTGSGKTYVVSPRFCQRWFNNIDKIADRPRKQLFGCFYSFGHPDYLFHVEVGTTHLHLGLVRFYRKADSLQLQAMTEEDHRAIMDEHGTSLKQCNLSMRPRSWGIGWYSYDVGPVIDLTIAENFSMMVAFETSKVYSEVLLPILESLEESRV